MSPTLLEAPQTMARRGASLRLPRRTAPQRHDAARAAPRRAPRDQRLLGDGRACGRGPASAERLSRRQGVRRPRAVRLRARVAPDREAQLLVSEESARKLFEEWSPRWDLSRPLLLEKSPPNLLKTRFLQALFPGSAFVVVVRHPIPVSIPTARWRGTRRYDRMFAHWLHCHALFEADRAHLGPRRTCSRTSSSVGDPAGCAARDLRVPRGRPRSRRASRSKDGANEKYFRQWQEPEARACGCAPTSTSCPCGSERRRAAPRLQPALRPS